MMKKILLLSMLLFLLGSTVVYSQSVGILEEVDYSSKYGNWSLPAYSSELHGGYLYFSDSTGDRLEYEFRGSGVRLYGTNFNDGGYCDVYLDDVYAGTIDQFDSVLTRQALLQEISGLDYDDHTLRYVVRGEKSPVSNGYFCRFDYLEYDPYATAVDWGDLQYFSNLYELPDTYRNLFLFFFLVAFFAARLYVPGIIYFLIFDRFMAMRIEGDLGISVLYFLIFLILKLILDSTALFGSRIKI